MGYEISVTLKMTELCQIIFHRAEKLAKMAKKSRDEIFT